MTELKFEAFRTNEDGSAVYIDAADLLAALGQPSTPEPEGSLDEERFDFTTQAGNAAVLMVYVTNGLGQHYRRANRADVTAALKEKGESAVKLSTGSDGLTKADRRRIFQDAYLRASEQGDPNRVFVSDCADAGYRALYNAGLALGEQKQAARMAELETERDGVISSGESYPKPRGGFNAPPWEPKPEPQPSAPERQPEVERDDGSEQE